MERRPAHSCGDVSSDEDELPAPPGVELRSFSVCSSISASSQSVAADSDCQLSVQSVPEAVVNSFHRYSNAIPNSNSASAAAPLTVSRSRLPRATPAAAERHATAAQSARSKTPNPISSSYFKTSSNANATTNQTQLLSQRWSARREDALADAANTRNLVATLPRQRNYFEVDAAKAVGDVDTLPKTPSRLNMSTQSGIPQATRRKQLPSPPPMCFSTPVRSAEIPQPSELAEAVKHVAPHGVNDTRTSNSMRVFLRVLNDSEAASNSSSATPAFITIDRQRKCIAVRDAEYETVGQRRAPPKLFGFDEVFTQRDSMAEISAMALKDIVEGVVNGNDACLFLYGPPKLDKLSALIGSIDNSATTTTTTSSSPSQQLGVLPCAISWLFALVNEQKEKSSARFSIRVSACEIHGKNEQVHDLLADVAKQTDAANSVGPAGYLRQQDISISEGSSFFESLSELRAPCADKAAQYFDAALAARSQCATPPGCNDEDDERTGHMVLTFHVYQYRVEKHGVDSGVSGGRSRLHIFDLAMGSRSRDKHSSALSYTALCNTILALLNGQRSLPYRESKLTQLLRDCMSSHTCRVSWLSLISAADERSRETVNAIQVTAKIYKTKRRLSKRADSSDNGSCDSFGLRRVSRLRSARGLARAARVTNALLQSEADYSSSSEQSCDTVIFVGGRLNVADSDSDDEHRPRVGNSKRESSADLIKRQASAATQKGFASRIPEEAASQSDSDSSSPHSRRGTPNMNIARLTPSRLTRATLNRENERWIDGPLMQSKSDFPASTIPPPPSAASQACIGPEFYHTGVEEVWIDGPKVFTRHNDAPSSSNPVVAKPVVAESSEASHSSLSEKGTQCEECEDGQMTPTSYSSHDGNAVLSDISEHTEQPGAVETDAATEDDSFMTDRSRAPSVQGSVDVQLQTDQLRSCPASMCTTPVRMFATRTNNDMLNKDKAVTTSSNTTVTSSSKLPATAGNLAAAQSRIPVKQSANLYSMQAATNTEVLSSVDRALKAEQMVQTARASPMHHAMLRRSLRNERERRDAGEDDRTNVPPTPPPLPPLLTAARADQEAQAKRAQIQQRRSFLSRTPTHMPTNSSRHSASSKMPSCRDLDCSPPPGPSTPIGNLDRVTKWLQSLESQQQQRCTQYEAALNDAAADSVVCAPQHSRMTTPSPLPHNFLPSTHTHALVHSSLQREVSTNNDSGISDLSRTTALNASVLSGSHSLAAPPHTSLPPPPTFGNVSQESMHPFAISSVLAQLQTDLPASSSHPRETKDADVQTSDDLLLPSVISTPTREPKSRKHGSFLRNVIFHRSGSSKSKKTTAAMTQSIFCGSQGVQTDTESACGASNGVQIGLQPPAAAAVAITACNMPVSSRDGRGGRSPSKDGRASPSKALTRMFTSPLFGKKKHKHCRHSSNVQQITSDELQSHSETHVSTCLSAATGSDLSTPISVNTQGSESQISIRAPSTSTGSGLSASSGIGSGTSSGVGLSAIEDATKKHLQMSTSEALKYAGYAKLLRAGGNSLGYDSAAVRDNEVSASTHNELTNEGNPMAVVSPFRCVGVPQRVAATPPRALAPSPMTTAPGKLFDQKLNGMPSKLPVGPGTKRDQSSSRP